MTIRDLINLVENGDAREYYGRLFVKYLESSGRVAEQNNDGSISIFWHERGAWRKETIRSSDDELRGPILENVRVAERGDGFPRDVAFKSLD
jgi:hypothetical protein